MLSTSKTGKGAAAVFDGSGFNSRVAVFVFLLLFGVCFFLFLLWSWVQIPSSALRGVLCLWCFCFFLATCPFVVYLIVPNSKTAKGTAVVSGGVGLNSWNAIFCSCLLLFFLCVCVSLFVVLLGSNPVQCASWCFVFVVFLFVLCGVQEALRSTRLAKRPRAPRSSSVVWGPTPGSLSFVHVCVITSTMYYKRLNTQAR